MAILLEKGMEMSSVSRVLGKSLCRATILVMLIGLVLVVPGQSQQLPATQSASRVTTCVSS